MVAIKRHSYKAEELDAVQAFLLEKASKRNRKLVISQQELAAEYGMEKTRFHRIIAAMVDEGRLKVIGEHARYATVIVGELGAS